jgi:transcriptional regulator with XRE-family HTH domain
MLQICNGFEGRFSELILDRGISREELASLLGVTRTTIWRLETGGSSPTLELLTKLQEAEFDVAYLLTGHKQENFTPMDDDEGWGAAAITVSKMLAHHKLNPSPTIYWRLVRAVYQGALSATDLKKNIAESLSKTGELAKN